MSGIEQSWQFETCDAIDIWAPGGEITIEGSDGDQITLEGDLPGLFHNNRIEQVERWLLIHLWEGPAAETELTLRLPRRKPWTVRLSSGQADVAVRDVEARLQIAVQRGGIRASNCRGAFAISLAEGDIDLDNCRETDAPEPPPALPDMQPPQPLSSNAPIPPFPPLPPILSGNWPARSVGDLTRWAHEAGEQARQFAQGMSRSFHPMDWQPLNAGIGIQISHGDVHIESIEARTCAIRVSKGDTTIEGGWIAGLDVHIGRGDIECGAILPAGAWTMQTAHGDISLSLPANTQARLDVATGHGDIHSAAALVRVSRPGPEGRYGGRMVGAVGSSDGEVAQINLEAMHGDIEIAMEHAPSAFTGQSAASSTTEETRAPEPAGDSVDQPEETVAAAAPGPAYASEMAILQALSEKQITAEEAEKLLLSMGT